jgi:signal transduction histidine kinase
MSDSTRSPRPPSACILAIDDEDANLRLLQALLQREGYRLECTRNPREAIGLFEEIHPDLVLVDLHMPGMDGLTVMRQIRESPCATGYLPILMLTGDSSPVARQKALAGGATDFVSKPFDGLEVTLRIRNLLEARRLHQAVQDQNARLEEMVRERTRELEVALARAEAAVLAKANFLAKMSHELRTPLNPIRGVLEVLAETAPASATRLLDMASRNVDRMAALIDDILYLQAIEQGNVKPDVYPVHLGPLVAEAVESVAGKAERGGLQAEVELPGRLAPVATDPVLLTEVLRRLLENAIRFTQEGSVTVRVETEEGSGTATRIEVRDTGIGIAPEQMRGIFEPFEQADNSTTRRYEGAGLGLAICQALAGLIGYSLEVVSAPGGGSTFSVVLNGRKG